MTIPNTPWLADLDRWFDSLMGASGRDLDDDVAVFERDDAWVLRLDLPGFRKEDLEVSVEAGTLTLRASTDDESRPFREEVRRSWRLGSDVAADRIEAKLEHGVLEITLAKKESAIPTSQKIEVH